MDKNCKVVFTGKSCVELQESDIPEIAGSQLLIQSEVSLISTGTELTMLEANVDEDSAWINDIKYPEYPGYSNVGKVIKVGPDGDQSLLGKRVFTYFPHEKYSVKRNFDLIFPIPDGVESEEAVFATLAQVALASIRLSDICPGDTVVVYGAGIVGQLVARLAKIAGALNVFVTDISDNRLNMLPDDASFIKVNTAKEDILEALENKGRKEKARIVFETTSVPALIEQEIKCLQKLGRLIITSSPKGKSTIDFDYCSRQGITIIGAHNSTHTPVATPQNPWTRNADIEYYFELLSKKQISLESTITNRENYKNAVSMYEMLMKDRTQALSVILNWND